ncbi:unnamed protein product, partial [Didymodactylos carnosus]
SKNECKKEANRFDKMWSSDGEMADLSTDEDILETRDTDDDELDSCDNYVDTLGHDVEMNINNSSSKIKKNKTLNANTGKVEKIKKKSNYFDEQTATMSCTDNENVNLQKLDRPRTTTMLCDISNIKNNNHDNGPCTESSISVSLTLSVKETSSCRKCSNIDLADMNGFCHTPVLDEHTSMACDEFK